MDKRLANDCRKYLLLLDNYQMATGFQEISGNTYFFSTGVMNIYGKTYYEGYMVTGWLTLGSDWYYFDNTGKRLTGLQKVGNNLFYFNDSGKMQTGWQKSAINGTILMIQAMDKVAGRN